MRVEELALPDVFAAGTRNGIGGKLLCHRLSTHWTCLTPHTAYLLLQLNAEAHAENSHLLIIAKKSSRCWSAVRSTRALPYAAIAPVRLWNAGESLPVIRLVICASADNSSIRSMACPA